MLLQKFKWAAGANTLLQKPICAGAAGVNMCLQEKLFGNSAFVKKKNIKKISVVIRITVFRASLLGIPFARS